MKYFFTSVLILALAVNSNAQLNFGIKAGINISKLDFSNDAYKTSFQPGLLVGAFGNYAINSKFSVQLEALYSMEGGKEKNIAYDTKGKIKESLLQIPILAQYKITPNFFVEAGPQAGILLAIKETYNGVKNDIKQYYKTTDFRFPVGIGYVFPESVSDKLSVDLRYSFSFSNINKQSVGGEGLKNQVISVGVAFRF